MSDNSSLLSCLLSPRGGSFLFFFGRAAPKRKSVFVSPGRPRVPRFSPETICGNSGSGNYVPGLPRVPLQGDRGSRPAGGDFLWIPPGSRLRSKGYSPPSNAQIVAHRPRGSARVPKPPSPLKISLKRSKGSVKPPKPPIPGSTVPYDHTPPAFPGRKGPRRPR